MSNIKLNSFAGIMPRTAAKLLNKNAAQVAHNCRLKSGRLEPVMQPSSDAMYPGGGRCRIRFSGGAAYAGLADNPKSLHLWRYKTTSTGTYVPEISYAISGASITNDGGGAFTMDGKADVWAFHSLQVTFTAWGTGTYNLGFKYRTTGDFTAPFSGAYYPGWAQKTSVRPLAGAESTLHEINLVSIKSNASNATWTAGSVVCGASVFTGETYLGSTTMNAITGASITAGSVVTVQFGTRIPAGLKLEFSDFAVTSSAALPALDVNGEGEYWLSWSDDVAVTSSTLADDDKGRIWIAGKTGVASADGLVTDLPAVIGMTPGAGAVAAAGCDASKLIIRRVEKAPYAAAPAASLKDLYNILASGSKPIFTASTVFGGSISYHGLTDGTLDANASYETVGGTAITQTGVITGAVRESGKITLTVAFPSASATGSITSQGGMVYGTIGAAKTRTIKMSGVTVANLEQVAPLFQSNNFGAETPDSDGASCIAVYKDGYASGTQVGELFCESAMLDDAMSVNKDFSYAEAGMGGTGGLVQLYSASLTLTMAAWTATIVLYERYSENGTYGANLTWTNGTAFTHLAALKRYADSTEGYYTEYLATWVDDWGQESPPSAETAQFYVAPGKYIEIAAASSPGATADKRRIYRTYGGEWRFCFELESDRATAWWDNVKNSELGEIMPTFENPPQALDGIISLPGGFLCGFVKSTKEICFSEPWLPYSYPTKYRLTVDAEPVALVASGNDIYVLTAGYPYIITGSHPDVMNIQKLAFPQACVSRRGVTTLGGVAFYVSHDGLCALASGAVPKLVTEKMFSRDDWQDLAPATMRLAAHDTAVFIFSELTDGDIPERLCTIIDFADGASAVTTADEWAVALFSDVQTDTLYYAKQVLTAWEIMAWNGSATPKTFKWRSKRFQGNEPLRLSALRLTSDRYDAAPVDPLTATLPVVRLYSGESPLTSAYAVADGASYVSVPLFSQKARRIPRLRPERVFEFEIEHNAAVDDIVFATGMEECKP